MDGVDILRADLRARGGRAVAPLSPSRPRAAIHAATHQAEAGYPRARHAQHRANDDPIGASLLPSEPIGLHEIKPLSSNEHVFRRGSPSDPRSWDFTQRKEGTMATPNSLFAPFRSLSSTRAQSRLLIMIVSLAITQPAHALPSFARQTGQECAACHVGSFGPQLTPYGVRFKMEGYTDSDGKPGKIPLSAMLVQTWTRTSKV